MAAGRPEPGEGPSRLLHLSQRERGRAPGSLVGRGAKALGLEHGQIVERGPYDLRGTPALLHSAG